MTYRSAVGLRLLLLPILLLCSAHWACVMKLQPGDDAVFVENVLAFQLAYVFLHFEIIPANRTL